MQRAAKEIPVGWGKRHDYTRRSDTGSRLARAAPFALVAVLALLLTACASTPPGGPAWLHGESEEYPSREYMLARGEAVDADAAWKRARAQLVSKFDGLVDSHLEAISNYEDAPGAQYLSRAHIGRELKLRVEEVVDKVEVADQWHDRQANVHHALAVLHRRSAMEGLEKAVAKLDAEAQTYVQRARTTENAFARVRAIGHALVLHEERAGLQRALRVIDFTGEGAPPPWTLGDIRRHYHRMVMLVSLRPESSGPYADEVRAMLTEAVTLNGFTVAGAAQYTIFGRVFMEELPPRWSTHRRRATFKLALRAGHGYSDMGEREWTFKASHRDPEVAERQILDQIAVILRKEMGDLLISFGY